MSNYDNISKSEGNKQNEWDTAGVKYIFRLTNSIRVLDVIEWAGTLTTCIKLNCKKRDYTYRMFMDAFHKLYLSVGLFTNNPKLLEKIEDAFDDNWFYESDEDDWSIFISQSWKYLNLFKDFVSQLQKDGIYDPVISHYFTNYDEQWKKSI